VTLVGVDATVCTVRATTSFLGKSCVQKLGIGQGHGETYGCLLDDYVFYDQFFKFQALCISIGLGILQEAGDELDGFLGPATCGSDVRTLVDVRSGNAPWVVLNCFAWLARPTPPE
jgi:hypothetical protein